MGLIKIFFCVFLIFVIICLVIAVYFYNFHVFKTLRVCISNDVQGTTISCSNNQDCIKLVKENIEEMKSLGNLPDFMMVKIDEVFSKIVYCDSNCKMKKIYGMGFGGVEEAEFCKELEEEIKIEIRGKEGWEFLKFMKDSKFG
ncbi:MAG: hypothetical protein KJ559_03755 [Nanoarchaeota archaeon]|nr:hypothetical protein [Nanoarchaeota archaeon]